jgi:hypothetical protein
MCNGRHAGWGVVVLTRWGVMIGLGIMTGWGFVTGWDVRADE